jgi:hypothetical protein
MNETVTRWSVEIYLSEIDGHTHAEARLMSGLEPPLTTSGDATLSEHDALDVAEVGFELATARALRSLADELRRIANEDVAALAG